MVSYSPWGRRESDTTERLHFHFEWPSGCLYLLPSKFNFAIRAHDLSHSHLQVLFFWLYTAFPLLAAKNVINLISVLTIWWCPCVESSLALLEESVCYVLCVLLTKLFQPLPCFILYFFSFFFFPLQYCIGFAIHQHAFCISRPNLPWVYGATDTPGISWLPTFAFQSPMMKRTSFFGVSSRRSCRSS